VRTTLPLAFLLFAKTTTLLYAYCNMSEALQIPGSSVPLLEMVAEQCKVNVEKFIGQSISLGLDLADIVLDAEGEDVSILFEQSHNVFTPCTIDFSEVAKPEVPTNMLSFESQFAETAPTALNIDDEIMASVSTTVSKLGTTVKSFLEASFFYRHQLGLTRDRGGRVFIDDPHDENYVLVVDRF